MSYLLTNIWNKLKSRNTERKAYFFIEKDHFDKDIGKEFEEDKHYFQIYLNEMYLANSREWIKEYQPMAFISAEYMYNKEFTRIPFILGPKNLGNGKIMQNEVIYKNIPITDFNPYKGGFIRIKINLSKISVRNYGKDFLNMLENFSDLIKPLNPLLINKISNKIFDGVNILTEINNDCALMSYEFSIHSQIEGQKLMPTYIVLINEDIDNINPNEFWIKNSQLHHGKDQNLAKPYRDKDFILVQISQGEKRNDEESLSFYPLWEQTKELAIKSANEFYWKETKSSFNALKRVMINSPDLTYHDFNRLINYYFEQIKKIHIEQKKLVSLSEKGNLEQEGIMEDLTKRLESLD